MRICHEKVREYVAATGMDGDRWHSAAPPGFLASALFVVAPDLLSQLAEFSVIHGEQTFTWHGPLELESDLEISGEVTRVRQRGETFFISFDMTVQKDGARVAEGTSLFLVSPASVESGAAPSSPPPALERGHSSPGQKSASRADLVRYAAATRDWNPIHWDHQSAVAAGLRGVVVHGLLQASWALDRAARGVDGDSPFRFAKIRFRSPLFTGHPVDLVLAGDGTRLTVEVCDASTQFLTTQFDLAEE